MCALSGEPPIHVLFLASWYPNRKEPTLGIFIRRHAQAVATIHKVTVLHAIADAELKEGEFRLERKVEGNLHEFIVSYGRSQGKFQLLRSWKNWRLIRKHYLFGLSKVIEWDGKPDLIHVHVPWPIGKIGRLISRMLKIPFGVTEHWTGYQPEDGRYTGALLKRVTRKTIRKAAFVAPVSEQLHKAMEAKGLKGNYTVIPNVVDTDMFIPGKKGHDKIRLIHVSSLDDAQKDVSGLLRAFQMAHREVPELELVIVGSGNDESALKRLSNELGLTFRGVDFKGKLQGEALVQELQQADALILNSRFENQPVVMLEALSCGLPVIAPAVGGIPEVIDDSRGILFQRDADQAVKKAMLLFCIRKDEFASQDLRAFALASFSKNAVARKLDELYRKTLAAC